MASTTSVTWGELGTHRITTSLASATRPGGHHRRRRGTPPGPPVPGCVTHRHLVAGLEQVTGHGQPHGPESDEAESACGSSSIGARECRGARQSIPTGGGPGDGTWFGRGTAQWRTAGARWRWPTGARRSWPRSVGVPAPGQRVEEEGGLGQPVRSPSRRRPPSARPRPRDGGPARRTGGGGGPRRGRGCRRRRSCRSTPPPPRPGRRAPVRRWGCWPGAPGTDRSPASR
jgi:hypothetical protein